MVMAATVPPKGVTKSQLGVMNGLLRTRDLPADSRAFIAARLVDPALSKREATVLVKALHRAPRRPLVASSADVMPVEDMAELTALSFELKSDKRHAKNNFIPASYDELFEHYFQGKPGSFHNSVAYKFIRTKLPTSSEEDLEDLCVEAYTWCYRKDVLAWFDPAMANFGAMIYWACRNATCVFMSKQVRNPLGSLRAGSLLTSGDSSAESDGVFFTDRLMLNESLDNQVQGPAHLCEEAEQEQTTQHVLDRVAVRIKAQGNATMADCFALQRQGLTHPQIARKLGLSVFAVGQLVKSIKQLALATEDEAFERKPRELKSTVLQEMAIEATEMVIFDFMAEL